MWRYGAVLTWLVVLLSVGCVGDEIEESVGPDEINAGSESDDDCPWDHLQANDCTLDCEQGQWPEVYRASEAAVVEAINERRLNGEECGDEWHEPVDPLEVDPVLREASRCHSVDMALEGELAHEGTDGREAEQRAVDAGYGSEYVGENLASGGQTPPVVVEQWVESEGHCRNLMHEDYQETAVGVVSYEGRIYFTQKFGRP